MTRKFVCAFCVLVVGLAIVSCKKLEPANPTGPLKYETVRFADAIPDEYGTLIAVTQNPQTPGWVGLWFQRSDKTITAVFVDIEKGQVHDKAIIIPRK